MKPLPAHLWHWVGILIVLCIIQFPIGETLVWDDELLVGLNPWSQDWNGIAFAWTHHLWQDIPGEHITHWYRPLMGTHLVVDQQIWGNNLLARQWINLIWLFCATGLLVDWLVLRFRLSPQMALFTGLLLTSSHLNTELIHFIAARNDTMALTFALLSAISGIKQRSVWLIAFFAFLSLCCKENGILFLLLFHLISSQFTVRQYIITLGVPFLIWSILRWFVIEGPTTPNIQINWTTLLPNIMSIPYYWIESVPSALNSINVHAMWPMNLVLWIGLFIYLYSFIHRVGLLILLASLIYTVFTFEQSIFGGFRYLYASYAIAIVLYINHARTHWFQIIGIIFICFNIQNTLFTKKQWSNNLEFWEIGYANVPTPQVACGSFMHLRPNSTLAIKRLSFALEFPVMSHCCAQATRYPIEINQPDLAIQMGIKAINNGCPNIPELLAPLALAYALQEEWDDSRQIIERIDSDPFGYKPVIETAIGLRNNDENPLNHWATKSQDKFPEMSLDNIKHEIRSRAESLIYSSKENAH